MSWAWNDMLNRWWIYLRETFHIESRIIFCLLLTIITNLLLELKLSFIEGLVGAITVFFVILYYRITDEFKDQATDLKYFPDRPIPSGRVKLEDLKKLINLIFVSALILNIPCPQGYGYFLAMWIFAFLMSRWFFLPQYISNNRLLAFITHLPIGWFCTYYLASLADTDPLLHGDYFWLISFVNLPPLVWEVARKTWAPLQEKPGYQTYSSLLGQNGAIALLGFILLLLNLIPFYQVRLNEMTTYRLILAITSIIFMIIVLRLTSDKSQKSINLKPWVEVFQVIFYITLLGQLLITK